LAKRKNILHYIKVSRMFLQNVKCLRYGTLRYVRVENRHNSTKRPY